MRMIAKVFLNTWTTSLSNIVRLHACPNWFDQLRAALYKKHLLECQSLPYERPPCQNSKTFKATRPILKPKRYWYRLRYMRFQFCLCRVVAALQPSTRINNTTDIGKQSERLPLSLQSFVAPAVVAVENEGANSVAVIGVNIGPSRQTMQSSKRRRSSSSSSASSGGDSDAVAPQRSLILDTARLRARREANLATFRAERGLRVATSLSALETSSTQLSRTLDTSQNFGDPVEAVPEYAGGFSTMPPPNLSQSLPPLQPPTVAPLTPSHITTNPATARQEIYVREKGLSALSGGVQTIRVPADMKELAAMLTSKVMR